MANKELSRRDFIKAAAVSAAGLALPQMLVEASKEKEALANLPIFYTHNTPVYIKHLTMGGNRIDTTLPIYKMYSPDWITISNMPLDILTPIRPESSEGIPGALGPVAWVADIPHVTGLQPPVLKAVVGYGDHNSLPEYINGSLRGKEQAGIVSTYAFTDKLKIYPAKIYNILTAFASIAEWQSQNGPFMNGGCYQKKRRSIYKFKRIS